MTKLTKTKENQIRRALTKQGYLLRKSRATLSGDNLGDYMIVDANFNSIVAGSRFNMSLEDVTNFLEEAG